MSGLTKEQEILFDELSENHAKHIADMPFLEDWIIDAMKAYAEFRIKEQANEKLETTASDICHGVVPRFLDLISDLDSNGLECGIEDVGITDRYKAMQYGFDECKARALEAIQLEVD